MGAKPGSAAASSCARVITGSRKHCGVWQRSSVSRRGIDCITPLAVTTMVSDAGTATPAASCTRSAATQSAMIRWSTSGRAASCSSTPQSPGAAPAVAPALAWRGACRGAAGAHAASPGAAPAVAPGALHAAPPGAVAAMAARAARVESGRVAPPSMTAVTFRYPASVIMALTCPVYPRAITTRISSMPGAWSKAATQCSTRVLPPSVSSCFGIPAPTRCPTPPPSTTATIRMSRTLPRATPRLIVGSYCPHRGSN